MPEDLINTFRRDSFRLEIFDTHSTDRARLAYRFYDSRMETIPVFKATGFFVGISTAIDSDDVVASMLSFFILQPGDTDAEYFVDYTQRQLEWRDLYAEELGNLHAELTEALDTVRERNGSVALIIKLQDDGTLDTVFSVFDCMTGHARFERFSLGTIARDESGAVTDAGLAEARELIESDNWEYREEALS